ncbi:MAG: AAA family ATPase [Cetobacterium sp.]|uniref:AAA family ATPase n=1 Tax=Cetobacterium sp. TaxID=2071632 RepID=UPI003F2BB1E0
MFKSLELNNFKKFQKLNFEELSQINIIVGENSIGKTSILEAIGATCDLYSEKNFLEVLLKRYGNTNYLFRVENMFNKKNSSDEILIKFKIENEINSIKVRKRVVEKLIETNDTKNMEVILKSLIAEALKDNLEKLVSAATTDSKEEEKEIFDKVESGLEKKLAKELAKKTELELMVSLNRKKRTIKINDYENIVTDSSKVNKGVTKDIKYSFLTTLSYLTGDYEENTLTSLINNQKKEVVLEILKYLEPNVIDINYSPILKEYELTLLKDIKYNLPISFFGDGLKKTLVLFSHIYFIKDGILLIDEIETGMHKNMLSKIYRILIKIAQENNVQIFLTTHSLEAIRALIEAQEDKNIITLHKVEEYEEEIFVDSFTGKKLDKLIFGIGGDPR